MAIRTTMNQYTHNLVKDLDTWLKSEIMPKK